MTDREKPELTPAELLNTLHALRSRMTGQQSSLRRGVMEKSGESGRTTRAPTHLADEASDTQEIDIMADRLTASSETIRDIDMALERLEKGDFNVCEECGREIGLRRLKIQPWARMCVECKRKAEE